MRQVRLGATGIETSCLGFGCASLGSRVEPAAGLRALEMAIERGIRWIDLAPIYGGGRAEELVAPLLARHRDRVQICTKVGLGLPAVTGGIRGMILPAARRLLGAMPALRTALRRRGIGAARSLPLTPDLVRTSLEDSLRRLGVETVDLYALHDPEPGDLEREPVLRALEDLVRSGKTRAVAVAGDLSAASRAVDLVGAGRAPFGIIQLPLPEPGAETGLLDRLREARLGVITHSVFGIGGALERMARRLESDPSAVDEVRLHTGAGDPQAGLARLLLERAFALNPDGVVLVSMLSERSLEENLRVAEAGPTKEALPLLDRLAA